jgi:hypothetical protein
VSYSSSKRNSRGGIGSGPGTGSMVYNPVTGDIELQLSNYPLLKANITILETVALEADLLLVADDIGQIVKVTATGAIWQQAFSPPTDSLSWVELGSAKNRFVRDNGGQYVDENGNRYIAVPGP